MLQPPRKSLSIRVQPLRWIISRLNNRLHHQGRLLLQMQWCIGSFPWWLPSTHVHPPQHQVTRITRARRATMFYFSKVAQWFRRTGAGIIQYRRQYTVNLLWWLLGMLTADLARDIISCIIAFVTKDRLLIPQQLFFVLFFLTQINKNKMTFLSHHSYVSIK